MIKCASFFAGVGGIDIAFEKTKKCEIVYANEFDNSPVKTYELNFRIKVDNRDIRNVKSSEVPEFDILFVGVLAKLLVLLGIEKVLMEKR